MKLYEGHKIRGIRRVSKKEARELLKLPWVLDEALSDDTFEARVLPDGRVLHFFLFDGRGNLYPSRETLEQALQRVKEDQAEWAKMGGSFDPAKELLPPLDDFIRDVDKLASSLGKVLHIPDEALDRSVESLDLVDKALVRVRIAKRMTPEVFTPVTAYLGEVMRLVCDGRWGKLPATIRKTVPAAYDPAEWRAYVAAHTAGWHAAQAAGETAAVEAKAKGANKDAVMIARDAAKREVMRPIHEAEPKPIRYQEVDEPVAGHEHEPVIRPSHGPLIHPVASVIRSLSERSTYGTLRTAVEGGLAPWLIAKRKAAARAGA